MNVYVIHINRNLDQQQFKRMASLVAKERCARLDKYIFLRTHRDRYWEIC